MGWTKLIGALAAFVLASSALAQDAGRTPRQGYLAPGEFDVTHILEPGPRKGDPRYETDRAIFRATRGLKGGDRWALATRDADYGVPALLHDFSCAVSVQLTPENAPRLVAVMQRAGLDTARQSSAAKAVFQRERPFTIDPGAICEPASDLYDTKARRMSYDYPSGHSTWGWTWALVLSAIAPDRAQPILERGRAYADSRFICGAHNESAVEAGMLSASATMALVSTKPEYQSDLAAAREELRRLRDGAAAPAQGCAAEAALVAQRVMPRLDAVTSRSGHRRSDVAP